MSPYGHEGTCDCPICEDVRGDLRPPRRAMERSVQIGEFILTDNSLYSPGTVGIHIAGVGEGGYFKASELATVLRQFYRERF